VPSCPGGIRSTTQRNGFPKPALLPTTNASRSSSRWRRRSKGSSPPLIHVGGFVLSQGPLVEVAPIELATMPGRTVIPWDKDDLDTLRFFKVDVLALGILSAIRKALALHFDHGADVFPRERIAELAIRSERTDLWCALRARVRSS